jgi:hypothetical protein
VSIERVRGPISYARHGPRRPVQVPSREEVLTNVPSDAVEFVRFCYHRRPVSWPALYDEMCAVAARGAFRGLGYAELADVGVTFCLTELPRLVAITEIVIAEERAHPPIRDQVHGEAPGPLALAQQATA